MIIKALGDWKPGFRLYKCLEDTHCDLEYCKSVWDWPCSEIPYFSKHLSTWKTLGREFVMGYRLRSAGKIGENPHSPCIGDGENGDNLDIYINLVASLMAMLPPWGEVGMTFRIYTDSWCRREGTPLDNWVTLTLTEDGSLINVNYTDNWQM